MLQEEWFPRIAINFALLRSESSEKHLHNQQACHVWSAGKGYCICSAVLSWTVSDEESCSEVFEVIQNEWLYSEWIGEWLWEELRVRDESWEGCFVLFWPEIADMKGKCSVALFIKLSFDYISSHFLFIIIGTGILPIPCWCSQFFFLYIYFALSHLFECMCAAPVA